MIIAQVAAQTTAWPQPLAPLSSLGVSALVAVIPLAVVMVLMGVFRKGGLFASACGFVTVALLALTVWGMPADLAGWSVLFGFATAAWSILWLVFNALWLYKLAMHTGSFDKLKSWLAHHASGDPCVQVTLVAFCFGALLEGSAGFGAPVAITAFLLVGLGFPARKAVLVSLIANTAPVAFGSVGVPIIALGQVTGLEVAKLSAMVGRQLPLLSATLPAYLVLVVGGPSGLKRTWPVVAVAGLSFAAAQFAVSNFVGPEATDVLSALTSIVATVSFLQVWAPRAANAAPPPMRNAMAMGDVVAGWVPWALLAAIIVVWSFLKIPTHGATPMPIHHLHNGVTISFNQ
ncbi:MAG TPA: L-lactate permease, partial [Gemmatimonadaceae bacterium]